MNVAAATTLPPQNPFATRCVRPGALPYIAPHAWWEELFIRFTECGYRAAIVGPHGSGKTTLLYAFVRRFRSPFTAVRWFTLQMLEGGLQILAHPPLVEDEQHVGSSTTALACNRELWIFDGFELLRRIDRAGLLACIRRNGHALLVTAHRRTSLPTLVHTESTLERFIELAEQQQRDFAEPLSRNALTACYRDANGNMREAFFRAFDAYERRQTAVRNCA